MDGAFAICEQRTCIRITASSVQCLIVAALDAWGARFWTHDRARAHAEAESIGRGFAFACVAMWVKERATCDLRRRMMHKKMRQLTKRGEIARFIYSQA